MCYIQQALISLGYIKKSIMVLFVIYFDSYLKLVSNKAILRGYLVLFLEESV